MLPTLLLLLATVLAVWFGITFNRLVALRNRVACGITPFTAS